jgi:hypothetical protein
VVVVIGKRGAGVRTGIREVTVYPAGVAAGGSMVTVGVVVVTVVGVVVVTTAAVLDKGSEDGVATKGIRGIADAVSGTGSREGQHTDQGL